MDRITIEMKLVKATSLEQFKTEQGTARMMMPYWVDLGAGGTEPGGYLFKFVNIKTDRDELEAQISYGIVWIQEKYEQS